MRALADAGLYVASESTMYRVLRSERLLTHREGSRPRTHRRPPELVAAAANEVWCWDITYLRAAVRGTFYYLYLVEDLYSRRIVGWQVLEEESAESAARLVRHTCEELQVDSTKLHLHSDNGGPMKGATMLATLRRLGIVPSFSRPRVSDDNPFPNHFFAHYRPGFPKQPFRDIEEARRWVSDFVRWYNTETLPAPRDYGHPPTEFPEPTYPGFIVAEFPESGTGDRLLEVRLRPGSAVGTRRSPQPWLRDGLQLVYEVGRSVPRIDGVV